MEVLLVTGLPEPECAVVWRCPIVSVCMSQNNDKTVDVWYVHSTVGRESLGSLREGEVSVSVDLAHDLSHRAMVFIWPSQGDRHGVSVWDVDVLGFVAAEAREVCRVAHDAITAGYISLGCPLFCDASKDVAGAPTARVLPLLT